jgi:hypothetical protein
MFCPDCKAEYRTGFVKCSDCGVNLVEHLSGDYLGDDGSVVADSGGRRLLWSGLSRRMRTAICAALDSAQIAHVETAKEFGLLPSIVQSASFIWVELRDHAAARSVLDKLLVAAKSTEQSASATPKDETRTSPLGSVQKMFGQLPDVRSSDFEHSPFENSLAMFEADADGEPLPDDVVGDFNPEDATSDVWSGEDDEMAQYVKLALAGIGIGGVLRDDKAKAHVFVLPANESRARELIREVIEGTPPQ